MIQVVCPVYKSLSFILSRKKYNLKPIISSKHKISSSEGGSGTEMN